MNGQGALTATIAGAYVFGTIPAIIASVWSPLRKQLACDSSPPNVADSVFHLSLIPTMLAGGFITDLVSPRWGLVGGSLLIATGLFLLSFGRNWLHCVAAIVVTAAGTAILGTATVALMTVAFFDASPTASLNLGFVFVGFGALLTPPAVQALIHNAGLSRALGISALVSLVPALIGIITPHASLSLPSANDSELGPMFASPAIWITGAAFALYVALEGSVVAWMGRQADSEPRPAGAGSLIAWFLIAALGSRMAMGYAYQKWFYESSEPWTIMILALLAAAAVGNMIGSQGRIRAVWGIIAIGILTGPILPTLISIVFTQFGPAGGSTAFGTMFAIGATGSLIISPLANAYANRHTARQALRAPLAAALLLASMFLVLGLTI